MINNFQQANKILASFVPKDRDARRYNLDNMRALMKYLSNPQDKLKVIHVAGTSGKTSTSYYIAAMLRSAGHKVGLSVSPHIDEINERAQINGQALEEAEYCKYLDEFVQIVKASNVRPSYFELLVAFAYWLFAKLELDYAVMEVGLGGLLDGTNVVNRADKVCVITDIGLDHVQILGSTIAEIATQKSGIIQDGNTVFMNRQDEAVMQTVHEACEWAGARLNVVDRGNNISGPASLPLFQRRNWWLAASVTTSLTPIKDKDLVAASTIIIPARMEVRSRGDRRLILDGSHNEQKISALVSSLKHKYPGQKMAVLVSFADTKTPSLVESISLLGQVASCFIVTSFKMGQDEYRKAIDPKQIAQLCLDSGVKDVVTEPDPNLATQLLLSKPDQILLVTGSFYLLNHVRPVVKKDFSS